MMKRGPKHSFNSLLMMYLLSGSAASLIFMLISFVLAILCHRHNRQNFRL